MTTVLNFIAVFRHVSEKMQIFQKRYQNRPSCKSLQHFFKWIHSWIPILHLQHLHIIRRAHITRPQCFIYFIPSMLFIHSPVISAKHPARCYQFLHTMHFFLQPPSCLKPSSVAYWMSRSACSPNFLIVFIRRYLSLPPSSLYTSLRDKIKLSEAVWSNVVISLQIIAVWEESASELFGSLCFNLRDVWAAERAVKSGFGVL